MIRFTNLILFAVTIVFLSGCSVKKQMAEVDYKLSILYSQKSDLDEKLVRYENRGVYYNGQCRQINRGSQPAFACGDSKEKAKISAAVCGTRGVQLCRNLVSNRVTEEFGDLWGGLANLVFNSYRESNGYSFCGQAITSVLQQVHGDESFEIDNITNFAMEASSDPYAIDALNECEGIICKQIDPTAHYETNEIGKKIVSSAASCITQVMRGCQKKYQEWYDLPEKLQVECGVIVGNISETKQKISALEYQSESLKRSLEYKILHLIGQI